MATKVTLLHNPGAGDEEFSKEYLLKKLQQSGYETNYLSTEAEDLEKELSDPGEFVIVAGGDGTVARIAKFMINKKVPLAILPMGTANNIATTLNISGTPEEIIQRWNKAHTTKFDVGVMNRDGKKSYFIESVGFGLFPRLIRQREYAEDQQTREQELEDALRHQKEILATYESHQCTIQTDRETFEGKYLLVEVMNIQFIGPNLKIAPDASIADGLLHIVLVREDERDKFARFLTFAKIEPNQQKTLPVYQAKKVDITWESVHYHMDDQPFESHAPIRVTVELMAQAIEFLT